MYGSLSPASSAAPSQPFLKCRRNPHPPVGAIICCGVCVRLFRLWEHGRGAPLIIHRHHHCSWCLLSCQGGKKWHFDTWTELGDSFSSALEISLVLGFLMFFPCSFLPVFPHLNNSTPSHDPTFTAADAITATLFLPFSGNWLNIWWCLTPFISLPLSFPCFWTGRISHFATTFPATWLAQVKYEWEELISCT